MDEIYNKNQEKLKLNHSKILKLKVKSMQRPGTEAIKTQSQPSKPKREITKITKYKENIWSTE